MMTSEGLIQSKTPETEIVDAGDIGFNRRMRETYAQKTLRKGEDQILIAQIRKGGLTGERAKARLVAGVEQYVIREAKKLQGRGVELEDLIQEGITGVLRAIETYDETKGFAFLTYADDWIRQRMLRACEKLGSIERYGMRITCHQYMANGRVAKVLEPLREELGREPTHEELAERAKLAKVGHAEQAMELLDRTFVSLDAQRPSDDSEVTVGEAIADTQAIDPVEETMIGQRNSLVWQIFSQLTEDEQMVLRLRLDLDRTNGGKPYTQDEVCEQMNIKKSRLVALQRSAQEKLHSSPELAELAGEMLDAVV